MAQTEKYAEYAAIITGKILELFDEDSKSNFHIDQAELLEGENLTHFFHALANVTPTYIYNKITEEEKTP